jgi:hypothetical protein
VDWIHPAQVTGHWRAFVNFIVNFRVPENAENFLTSWAKRLLASQGYIAWRKLIDILFVCHTHLLHFHNVLLICSFFYELLCTVHEKHKWKE